MARPSAPDPLNVEQLLEAIDRLAPAQRRELGRRLAWRQLEDGNEARRRGKSARSANGLPQVQ
jgi:hypothetical protein